MPQELLGGLASLLILSALHVPLYTVTSLGFNILYSSTRIVNVAYGDLVVVGAYIAYWMHTIYRIPPPLSAALAAAAGAGLGILLYAALFRRILSAGDEHSIELQSVISTFGLSITIQGLAALAWSSQAVAYTYLEDTIPLGPLLIPANLAVIAASGLAAAAALYIFLYRTYTGIAVRGIIQAPRLAFETGLRVERIYMVAAAVCTAMPMAAGALISPRYPVSPFAGLEFLALSLVVTVMGGLGNPLGSVAGALAYSAADSLVGYLLPPGLKLFYTYALLIALLLARPTGILGKPYVVR